MLDLIKNYLIPNTNTIDLGTMNGWSNWTQSVYTQLSKLRIEGTSDSMNLGRCYNAYSFDILIDYTQYTVTYKVDSSD
jgi:hypothetical protein